jgi:HlyD family secretion protein
MSADKETLDALRIDRANPPRGRVPAALIVAALAVVAVAVGALLWFSRPKAVVVRTVVVQEAASGGDKTLLNASGYVNARRKATVSSKVTGKVVDVLVEEGMKVESGQVLARVDSSNVEKSLHLAKAQLESARKALGETKANLVQAERELQRLSRLAAGEAASPVELERAETEEKSLKARLERQTADVAVSEREVALWEQQLDDTVIRAPFAGIVTTKNAQPGEMISPMSVGGFTRTGICTIVDMTSLEIEVDVSESYLNRVESGQPVEATLDSYPDWHIPARVIAIIPTADRQKATVKVRVGFDKLDPRILPDMSVKVAFQSGGEAGAAQRNVTVPKAAVRQHDGRDLVWVVRDGRVERRAVTLGTSRGDQVFIAAGVGGGDRVVVEGPDSLADGARVTEARR